MKRLSLCLVFLFGAFTSMWAQLSSWSYYEDTTMTFSSPRATDLNGDGIKDIVLGAGAEKKTKVSAIAVDGEDGSLLWKKNADDEMFISAIFLDVNGDGTKDAIVGGRTAELYCLNGKNGNTIWEYFPYNKNKAADSGYYNFYQPQIIPDQNNDGIEELLITNGGDKSKSYTDTVGRPAGKIMVINGKTGKLMAKVRTPDKRETYMAPVVHDFNKDGKLQVILGTGGETMSGSLWVIQLEHIMNKKVDKAERLLFTGKKGFIPPPCIADVNGDRFDDLIVNAYNGDVIAFSGEDLAQLWRVDLDGYETQCTPAIGNFVGSHHPDVLAVLYKGNAPAFKDYIQLVIDGYTGKVAWRDSMGDLQFASPNAFDYDGDGFDEALLSFNTRSGSTFTHSIAAHNFRTNKTEYLVSAEKGINLSSTPLVEDLDGNGELDLVYAVGKNDVNPTADDGIYLKMLPDICEEPKWGVAWGSYLGTQHTGRYTFKWKNCNSAAFDVALTKKQPSCNLKQDGSLALTVSPGAKPIRYNWSDGTSHSKIENRGQGTYQVRIIDNNGCTELDTYRLKDPYEISIRGDSTFCYGDASGNAVISSSGCQCAHSGCTYKWSNGSEDHGNYGVKAGVYSVILTHNDGCVVYDTVEVFDTDPILDTAIINHISCYGNNDGAIELIPSDTTEFQAIWKHGQRTSWRLDSLKPDTYHVEVINYLWCSDTLDIVIREPDSLKMRVLDYDHINCFGDSTGTVTLAATGGWMPYQYYADSTLSRDSVVRRLKAGDRNMFVRDSAGCTTDTQKVTLFERPEIKLTLAALPQTDQFNDNGSAWVSVEGGLEPYYYKWDDPLKREVDSITNLKSNTYRVVVTDSLGCKKSGAVVVEFDPSIGFDESTPSSPMHFRAYPVPVENELFVNLTEKGLLTANNAAGQTVFQQMSGAGVTLIPTSAWDSGIYILSYQSGSTVQSMRLVVR